MQDFGLILRIPEMSRFGRKALIASLHEHAEIIADDILKRIEDRTPEDTGALKEDETYTLPNGGGQSQPIVTWYVGSAYQLAENKRDYAAYQEGPPLGLETYTNGPHQMFYKVSTDDIPLIRAWAEAVVNEAAEEMAQQAEAGATEMRFP